MKKVENTSSIRTKIVDGVKYLHQDDVVECLTLFFKYEETDINIRRTHLTKQFGKK